MPLDWIKFAMKATVIKSLRERRERQAIAHAAATTGVPITRTQSRAASIHESLYSNRVSFIKRAARKKAAPKAPRTGARGENKAKIKKASRGQSKR